MDAVFLGYLAAVLLPVLYVGIPNPVLLRWFCRHGSAPIPSTLRHRADVAGNLIPFIAVGLLFLSLLWLLRVGGQDLTSLGLTYADLRRGAPKGIAAGCAWLSLYAGVLFLARPRPANVKDHLTMAWPLLRWLLLSVPAAIVEEIWRAYCLTNLMSIGGTRAILLTTLAFGIAHIQSFGRALAATCFGTYAAYLFVNTGLLSVPLFAHAIVNVGVFFLIRVAVRRDLQPGPTLPTDTHR